VRLANEQLVDENLSLRREASARFRPENFIGRSLAVRRVLGVVERAASIPSTVLITGESGTGKELIALMLHHSGPRAMKPFLTVNCGAIPEPLLESELFGHERGAFTDARRARPGKFELAHQGTIFLDEIGDMPLAQQVKLLRVLAEETVTRVGGDRPIPVDVRIIAASNRDLPKLMAEGRFREDLWYRLNVIPIEVPPLRERKADIPALAQHFAALSARRMGRERPGLSSKLLAVLMQSDWPGNVRELQAFIERLMAMTPGEILEPTLMPGDLRRRAEGATNGATNGERAGTLEERVAELEKELILRALDRNQGNQCQAARELGMTEQSLRYRLRKYHMASARLNGRTR
jgi:transcriptional regulator with PAS, ATPase and Fis domain